MRKALLVIGAGPGIGAATAQRFAKEGWKVVVGARDKARLDALVQNLRNAGVDAHAVEVDASQPTSVRDAVASAESLTGGLGAVLYNAAVMRFQDLFSMTDAEIVGDLATNIAGALFTVRAAVEIYGLRGGAILLTGGGAAMYPHANYPSLSIGKAGVRNIAQGLHPALAEKNIRIGTVTVCAGIQPGSKEAADVADCFWSLATNASSGWEITYPSV